MNEFNKMLKEADKTITPLDMLSAWYKQNGKTVESPKNHDEDYQTLRRRYDQNPESLNPTQLLILGSYERDMKRQQEEKKKQAKVNEYMKPYHEAERENEEFISTNSEEFKQLAKQMAELQAEFQRLNGVGE